jgi:hypothetical protein
VLVVVLVVTVVVVMSAAQAESAASARPLPSLSRPTVLSKLSWAELHGSVRLFVARP